MTKDFGPEEKVEIILRMFIVLEVGLLRYGKTLSVEDENSIWDNLDSALEKYLDRIDYRSYN